MADQPTRVVNLHVEQCDVYCGRKAHGYQESKFRNPYYTGTREDNIRRHELAVRADPAFIQMVVRELAGKRLGCWCAPAACHCDVYVEIIREAGLE